jgi:hypothetical protein
MCNWTIVHCDECVTYPAPHKTHPVPRCAVYSPFHACVLPLRGSKGYWCIRPLFHALDFLGWMISRPGNVDCTLRMHCPIPLPVMLIRLWKEAVVGCEDT